MPIECSKLLERKTQKEFHSIDNIVTGIAFDIQNKFGRFYDERIYNKLLIDFTKEHGFKADGEVAIKVTYKDFRKLYYLDILIDNGIVYELKTVEMLNKTHEQQLINYLLLTGLNHGKLINFRSTSVEKQFCSNRFSKNSRKNFILNDENWDNNIPKSKLCKNMLTELLNDWGAFLDFNLYKEALIHFMGGQNNIVKPIDIIDGSKVVGQQKVTLLNKNTAFHVTGISRNYTSYAKHISHFLEHTNLTAIQWINFNKNEIKLIRRCSKRYLLSEFTALACLQYTQKTR